MCEVAVVNDPGTVFGGTNDCKKVASDLRHLAARNGCLQERSGKGRWPGRRSASSAPPVIWWQQLG